MKKFTIKHLLTPGSGLAPNGTGSAGVTISGGSQTGETINTTGWPTGTSNVVMPGDVINIAGTTVVYKILESANSDGSGNATLTINPPIFSGGSPANGAAVTTTDVTYNCRIIGKPNTPNVQNSFHWGGLTVNFLEVPN
jgi:hypothetical protein